MHREWSNTDDTLQPPRAGALYLLTGILLFLVGRDLAPYFASGLSNLGLDLPTASREIFGFRYALIAAVIGGARVLYGSLERLLEGKLGADLALAIACIAAIVISEPLVAAEVVLIGLIGECLENFTFSRTQKAIRNWSELFPRRCWLLRAGAEVRVLVTEVQVGDIVVVKPGAKIPVDGIVRDGRSAVDVSALTGESLPLDKGPNDGVLAGSVNQFGALTIEATRVQEQTVAGRVMEITAKALKEKAPMERHADRLAKWFLPAVLALATVTFLANFIWYAGPLRGEAARMTGGAAARLSVYPTLAVLVVACPCALILATPAAVIAALGRLAGTGVLLKSGAALERLAGVTAFAFDKTGTLTSGKLELGDVLPLTDAISADELLAVSATAEHRSEHPLARLIVQESQRRQLPLGPIDEFAAHPGAGVRVVTSGRILLVGTQRLLTEQGIAVSADAVGLLDRLDAAGQTPLLVARDGEILGAIGARDQIRPEAYGVLNELRELGIAPIALLTGDRPAVAAEIASQLGITDVHSELLPEGKADWIAGNRRVGQTAFVGDGINDAPALARAAVGLAVGEGTELAAEAGDIVLMGEPLRTLPLLVRLSRQTVAIIRQNIIIFAFAVNLVGIAVTAWLWPLFSRSPDWYEKGPIAGAIYHQIGSLLVLLNSMRLLAFERQSTKRAAARFGPALRRLDTIVDRLTDLDEMLHTVAHHWKPWVFGLTAIAGIGYAWSGMVAVGPDEVAVVRRFGRPLDDDLFPGLHWRWPWPVESIDKIQPDRVRTVEVGFRMVKEAAMPQRKGAAALTWLSQHEGEGVLRLRDEAIMPTGDGNLVEMLATVQFHVRDPHRYLLEVRDPDEILRANLESVLRETAAGESFLDLLTERRDGFQREVFFRLNQRLDAYAGNGLGVTLDGMTLRDLHPPEQVVGSFHAVAQAAEERDRRIKDAEEVAMRARRSAESEAIELTTRAESDAHKTVQTAMRDRDVFLAWYQARREIGPADQSRLFQETMQQLLDGGHPLAAALDHDRRRREQIELQTFLIDFRLTWQALGQTLGQRDKVFLDADQLPGRRTLMLFGPDQLTPPPIVIPNRSPQERQARDD